MTAQLAIIDIAALDRLEKRMEAMQRLLERSTVIPRPEWVSISEAAAFKKCSASTIRRMIDAGELEARGAGKARRVKLVE